MHLLTFTVMYALKYSSNFTMIFNNNLIDFACLYNYTVLNIHIQYNTGKVINISVPIYKYPDLGYFNNTILVY